MPLVAAAVCPSSPLLVPDLATGAAGGLDDPRAACDAAVAGSWSARPELVAVVGPGARTGESSPPYPGSSAPWGHAVPLGDAGPDAGRESLVRCAHSPSGAGYVAASWS